MVTYNSSADLDDCLASLRGQSGELDLSITVVDNASADDSAARARQAGVTVVANEVNRGFGAAVNQGARQGRAPWLLLINPDARLEPNALSTLIKAAESGDAIGCVGPRVLDADGTEYPSRRRFPNLWVAAGHAVLGPIWPGNPATKRYMGADVQRGVASTVDWVSGCCMLVNRQAWQDVAGFDEKYFLYLEDVDLCWRMRRAGWRTVWEPAVGVTHVGGGSSKSRPLRSIMHHHVGAARFFWRSAGWHRPITWPLAVVTLVLRGLVQLVAGKLRAR